MNIRVCQLCGFAVLRLNSRLGTRVDSNGISAQPIPHAPPIIYAVGADKHVGVTTSALQIR